jgi:hypothetical protein
MTEAEWLACTDPLEMLKALSRPRALRLFAVACCRRILHLMTDERSRKAVEVAERFADGEATEQEREAAHEAFRDWSVFATYRCNAASATTQADAAHAAVGTATHVAATVAFLREREPCAANPTPQEVVALLHEVFGNPYRPISPDPYWLTADVIALAQAAYAERILPEGLLEPQRLAVLADALEDAGCADQAILAHLRGEGPHVRGCWVIDLVLGKE